MQSVQLESLVAVKIAAFARKLVKIRNNPQLQVKAVLKVGHFIDDVTKGTIS